MMPDHVAGRIARRLIFTSVAGEISVPEFGGIFGKAFVADVQLEGERSHAASPSGPDAALEGVADNSVNTGELAFR